MQLITPSQQTVTTTYTGGGLGVGTPKNVSATIPLYETTAIRDFYTTSSTPITQSYTATSTAPNGLLPGFIDPITGEFYQKMSAPSMAVQKPVSLVDTIQQPQPGPSPATSFRTVPYHPEAAAPAPKLVAQQPVVRSKPVIAPTPMLPAEKVIISDDVRKAVELVKELMARPAVKRMVNTYQNEGTRGLFHWSTLRQGLSLFSDRNAKQSVNQLIELLKSPEVQAAIRNPQAVLGNDKELNELLDIFHNLGLVQADDDAEALAKPVRSTRKKPVVEEEVATSDSDEGDAPIEASSDEAEDIESFIKKARAAENEVDDEPEAAPPVHKHTSRRKMSAETSED
jgi:hypothetical protein